MRQAKEANMDCAALYKILGYPNLFTEDMLYDWNIMLFTQANFDWTMTHSIPWGVPIYWNN